MTPKPSDIVIDRDALDRMCAVLDTDTVLSLLEGFVEEMLDRSERLAAAADAADDSTLGAEAHALKSAAGTYGARELADLCAGIERSCRDGAPERGREAGLAAPALANRSAEAFSRWRSARRDAPGPEG
ncbi:MAG: Hpt domain-containing protein [Azospirillaceae bacterium]